MTTTTAEPTIARQALVALALASGSVVALGFTRFAYALLLPPMHEVLDWTYAQAGGMNTANALGYIIGAATAALLARKAGGRQVFLWSLAVSALALLATAATTNFASLLALRFVGGLATAVTFVVGSVLASHIVTGATQRRSALMVAVYMAGVGIGVVISGLVVPISLTSGASGWRLGWLLMGAISLVALVPAWLGARSVTPSSGAHSVVLASHQLRRLAPTFVWYLLYGAGYVSYMTFVIALLKSEGLGGSAIALYFVVLGLASVVATLAVWGHLAGRLRAGQAPALVAVLVFLGVLPLLLLPTGIPAAMVSAVVFGASFMAGPTAATVIARRMLPHGSWTAGIALLTVAFSVGQAIGPLVSGLLSDSAGGITNGLWLSAALLILAAVAALFQRDHHAS
ncbi:YbfB/YjiJ family MFS transporter [Kribbella shirazensis]|uniref:Putative MFS family arabinose efflux permease n=1 Tax=Kribbella shirazensis TaxID=1105143 RepID=A0A7X5VHE3_9ACTN|nr:YbfB/YjiJ family MFS transporter [Kribbella shirazensis]NIK61335.1 putative MFS family arabinose efflux permease [Kribbella shirazensis]